jgi:hypothetical protein
MEQAFIVKSIDILDAQRTTTFKKVSVAPTKRIEDLGRTELKVGKR